MTFPSEAPLREKGAGFGHVFDLDSPPSIDPPDVTAVVLCHNEKLRLRHFLDHHKACGVGHFLVVDNDSTDGSDRILRDDPDVTLFPSSRPYSEYKSAWREVLADQYLAGKWVVFLDVDEILIHPTWPHETLQDYTARLQENGYDCVLAVMVDMYPEDGSGQPEYQPGTPFVDYAPCFDAGNYRLESYPGWKLRRYRTPKVRIRGGARERLFHTHASHHGPPFLQRLTRAAGDLSRDFEPGAIRRGLDMLIRLLTWRRDSGPGGLPDMSKVPLMRWRRGAKFRGGVHRIDADMNLAPDLAALLHFKYLGDFHERVDYNLVRGQHTKGSAHYRRYSNTLAQSERFDFTFSGTQRFTGPDSLKKAGLIRSRT